LKIPPRPYFLIISIKKEEGEECKQPACAHLRALYIQAFLKIIFFRVYKRAEGLN